MKVVAFNGSARKDGNTAILINLALDELKREGIETELIQLAGQKPRAARAGSPRRSSSSSWTRADRSRRGSRRLRTRYSPDD